MNEVLKKRLLEEAINIGDALIDKSEEDDYGIYWNSMSMGAGKEVQWSPSESIYTGSAGIILFFIELHRQTQNEKYLETALTAAKWLEHYCEANASTYYAFFTGRMGVAHCMLQLAIVTGDQAFNDKALKIAKDCDVFLDQPDNIDDLINGTSGTLLSLLHLHAMTGEERVMEQIERYTKHLITHAHPAEKGLYWDRSSKNIRGLCGFSHGASGIGYVFLQLGKYFGNDAFLWLAEQAFEYENNYFNQANKNWPDFRKGIFDEDSYNEHKEEYLNNNLDFFTMPGDMSAWCHGAPGIGLSRISAIELLGEKYSADLENAVEKTKIVNVDPEEIYGSYTLCHGGGGNAMLFLEAFRLLGDNKYLELAEKVGEKSLAFKERYPYYISGFSMAGKAEDTSLFMGNAGIGYFYLQLLDPSNTPSVLKPDIPNGKSAKGDLSALTLAEIKNTLASKIFPRTAKIFEQKEKQALVSQSNGSTTFVSKQIVEEVEKKVKSKNNVLLNDILELESHKWNIDQAIKSDSYLFIRTAIEAEKNSEFLKSADMADLLKQSLTKPKEIVPVETKNNWEGSLETETISEDMSEDFYLLLAATQEGTKEFPLNQFAYLVIDLFEDTKTVQDALQEIINAFEINSDEEKAMLEDAAVNQIKEAMVSGFLLMQ